MFLNWHNSVMRWWVQFSPTARGNYSSSISAIPEKSHFLLNTVELLSYIKEPRKENAERGKTVANNE